MDINIILTIVATFGGLSGMVTAVSAVCFKIAENRRVRRGESWEAKLDAKLQPLIEEHHAMHQENAELHAELREIRLDTTRIQLLNLMHDEPTNHDTILIVAHRYFVELKGDWVASVEFQAWADKEKINIPTAISQAIAENDK